MAFASDTFTGTPVTELSAYNAAWSKQSGFTANAFIGADSGTYAICTDTSAYSVYVRSESPSSADYSVFCDITRRASGTNKPEMGPIGRAQSGVGTFYALMHFDNVNETRLYKCVSGTFTQIGSGYSLTLTTGVAVSLELRMSGTSIKGFVNGVERISVTDSSISGAGKAGIIGRRMRDSGLQDTGSIDNFDAVDGASSDTISITSPVTRRVFQRSGSTGSISITGSHTGATSNIEARFNGGAWTTIATAVAAGSYSGTLSGQAQGQGTLEVRKTSDTAVTASVAIIGIGDVFVVAGDSISEGRATNAQSYTHATLDASKFTQSDVWADGIDPIDVGTANGSHWPLLATQIMEDQGVPVAFISVGKGATDVAGSANTWAKNNAEYAEMTAQVTASGVNAVKAALFHLGPNAVVNATTLSKATYNAAIDTLASNIAADIAGAPKLHLGIFGEVTTGSPPDRRAAIDNIRGAIIEAYGDNANVLPGPCLIDQDYSDGVHPQSDAALAEVAKRWWVALKASLYGGSGGRGPRLSSAQWNGARTQLTVTFDRALKVGLSHSAAAWSISDNGSAMTISGIAYHGTDPNALVITTSAAASGPAGTTTVTFASGNDATGLVVPLSTDITMPVGSAIQIPAEPIYAAAVQEFAVAVSPAPLTTASVLSPAAISYTPPASIDLSPAALSSASVFSAASITYTPPGGSATITLKAGSWLRYKKL